MCEQGVWDPTRILQDGLGVSLHVRVYRWATHGKTGPNGAPGSETRREDSFCSANVSFHSRGLENKRLFQNKWGLSAPAMERAAKRLLGGKGHANIGLIPLSSRCLQRCSGNIPTSCAARHCKAQAAAWGWLLTHGSPGSPFLAPPDLPLVSV